MVVDVERDNVVVGVGLSNEWDTMGDDVTE